MGKKSREKRERKAAKMDLAPHAWLQGFESLFGQRAPDSQFDSKFQRSIEQTSGVLRQYKRVDVALALSISDLWPANASSPIKHMFAWSVLLRAEESPSALPITTYADFVGFANALVAAWPDFPMLEDFAAEADWGQTRVRLESDFVPIFYGSCIERIPDFVEAFRISYADVESAQADMNLAVAAQSCIIKSMPDLANAPMPHPGAGYVEVPPEEFWLACRSTIIQLGKDLADRRAHTSKELEASFGVLKDPLTHDGFGDAVMRGQALPFLAVTDGESWVPVSVRNMPGVVIDYWATRHTQNIGGQVHKRLGRFIAERFSHTRIGPITLITGNTEVPKLTISCLIPSKTGIYLVCACDHQSYLQASNASQHVYAALKRGERAHFQLADGRGFSVGSDRDRCLKADDVHILIVLTQSGTGFGMLDPVKRPARLMPLADLITIFDDLDQPDDIEAFWKFVDGQRTMFNPFSSGLADQFASYIDSHGVLVDGAMEPSMLMLDTSWGTSRRFKELSSFWSLAPGRFPIDSTGWRLSSATAGVTRMESRSLPLLGFSTQNDAFTVQSLVPIVPDLQVIDGRMLEMVAHLLVDQFYRHRDLLSTLPLLHRPHLVLICSVDTCDLIAPEQPPEPLGKFPKVIINASRQEAQPDDILLKISTRAVLAGLNGAKDASFEVRCLIELLQCCHKEYGLAFSADLAAELRSRATDAARFHLQHAQRLIDVPDFVDPVTPSPMDYKQARKHLAVAMQQLGLNPGRYELKDAKAKIDAGRDFLRGHIEQRLASLNRHQLIQQCIEQHDALAAAERFAILRAQQSLAHDVEYDRFEVVEKARKEYGAAARHYRYLLEKVLSSTGDGAQQITSEVLRELVGLVDWYKVLADAGDVLHTGVDVGGIEIDDFHIPKVFYSTDSGERGEKYAREYAKSRLGIDLNDQDEVVGPSEELMADGRMRQAFKKDVGFELQHLLSALVVLSQPVRLGLTDTLALSYVATSDRLSQLLTDNIEGLGHVESDAILEFLTLSGPHIRRLAGREVEESEVPYWEHNKRTHRYAIRPLISEGDALRWGAETASRALNIWSASVRDGYLPADFSWSNVEPLIREIKEGIEKQLEVRAGEVLLRHTPYVMRNLDFKHRFRGERFDDVGDFDVFAYWPETNTLLVAECKYNQPPYSMKDTRRLRDKIFGKSEGDRNGQFSRILRRREFLSQHRSRLLELLGWPSPQGDEVRDVEIYVSRIIYYWMVHPPYEVPTAFIRIDALDAWLTQRAFSTQASRKAFVENAGQGNPIAKETGG
ncbi:hypothetical protein SAMN02745900_00979 [Pseudomonas sp. URIL14HWK12:I8]|uniref:hypothetical protein n=1 Tax=unclassified Pseudomonas TaxID=196821 RepID=UPI0004274310|nr:MULTISPECIES: hypothetical protein [unclassified Pseudomonas]SNB62706.1 hypothetical protein SAMN02745900_00979 [Pseudomonas sp. URIL14HWK12:I8]